ncbi:hypothetical protein ONE63_005558 [Megalurothrips usitatus]|uniref:Kinesin-like protein n=1 Tax=Megalurothrips usitatus TaxID=439358 RepID=A0AAV7XZS9_9NEOP|nr:hypothetical protein ONE63_005558 [Megalurothrips usitatus]
MESVVAAVRCRPMSKSEIESGNHKAVQITSSKQVIVSDERAFTLNHAYSEESSQDEIFNDLVNPVVEKVMNGFNACVMAYGQTGSGKTFTMGTKAKVSTPGIVQRALNKIISSCVDAEIHVSFLEVYKEEVLDLLSLEKKKMPVVDFKPVGLTLVRTSSVESALSIMEKGLKNRHVGTTNANLHSSRSHAVFTIYFTQRTENGQRSSKLYLVDLAGSESVAAVSGDTRREGVMINKGLLQLGIVMSALSSAVQEHVPYRNSALTAILKDTLSPQNFVVLIACISPLDVDATMTVNSLQFASRVGSIKGIPEAGLLIKQRLPVTTPFKVPSNIKHRVNATISTPGSLKKIQRPALRPLNHTFDSPRTPRLQDSKKQHWPTSTPLQNVVKPLFADPTPIPKTNNALRAAKRRSSSEWDPLNVSTSTVVDSVTSNACVLHRSCNKFSIYSPENEKWLRSIIADVFREELKNLSQTVRLDGPSPPKQPRRSARLSKNNQENLSFFEHDPDATAITLSSPNRNIQNQSVSKESVCSTNISQSVRRSTRLSVAPHRSYYPEKEVPVKAPKLTKKAARFSTRLSILPTATPENAQKQLNDVVLDVLRSGDVKKLQSLPTIGPKTAVIISNHSLLNGPVKSFQDLENIRGLSKNFTKRFLWANNIILDE